MIQSFGDVEMNKIVRVTDDDRELGSLFRTESIHVDSYPFMEPSFDSAFYRLTSASRCQPLVHCPGIRGTGCIVGV
jgi:hypothetical protein